MPKDNQYWLNSWKKKRIAFNQEVVNTHLQNYLHRLIPNNDKQIRCLVPLCGKSIDMLWLYENDIAVTGIELSEIAVEEFFTENYFKYTNKQPRSRATGYLAVNLN